MAEPGAVPPNGFHAADGEDVIGWYINEPAGPLVVFTTIAIHVVSDAKDAKVETTPLDDLLDYELPASKRSAEGVFVRTPSGKRFLPMRGAHGVDGRFPDAWSLVQVLRVLVGNRVRR